MTEEQVKVSSLVERLAAWCEQQPEYPYLFLADRARRRRAATIVSRTLLTLPYGPARVVLVKQGNVTVPVAAANRKQRRLAVRQSRERERGVMQQMNQALAAMEKEEAERETQERTTAQEDGSTAPGD